MINNRQNGRRRGRGGPRPQGMEGRPSGGGNNRPETRARGNAPQLHEKYKALARDAQLAGDRVQTEYYLQFADHYYRILNENRPRFDEQRPSRENGRDDASRDEGGQDQGQSYSADEYDDEDGEAGDDEPVRNGRYDTDEGRGQPRARDNGYEREARPQRDVRPQRDGQTQRDSQVQQRDGQPQRDAQPQPQREARPERDARPDREARPERDDRPQRTQPLRNGDAEGGRVERPRREARPERGERPDPDVQTYGADRPARDPEPEAEASPVHMERPKRARAAANGIKRPHAEVQPSGNAEDDGPGIDLDRLPPAISRPEPDVEASEATQEARPPRRPRRPREAPPADA